MRLGACRTRNGPASARPQLCGPLLAACDARALEMHSADLDSASRTLLLSQAGPTLSSAYEPVLLVAPAPGAFSMPVHRASTSTATTTRPVPRPGSWPRASWSMLWLASGSARSPQCALGGHEPGRPSPGRAPDRVVANSALWHRAQVAVGATIVSPVTGSGDTRPPPYGKPAPTSSAPGAARRDIVGVEVGGHFGAEAAELARHRAESTPSVPRPAAQAARLLRCPSAASRRGG